MKVVFFIESFGNTTFISNQINQVATFAETYCLCNKDLSDGSSNAEIIEIDFPYPKLVRKLRDRLEMHQIYLSFANRFFAKKLQQIITELEPDLIHLQFGYEAIKFLDNAGDFKIPTIIHFRGYDASQMLKNRAYRSKLQAYLARNHIWPVAVCKHLINNLKQHSIQFANSPSIIYSNTDTQYFHRNEAENHRRSPFTLVQISSFREKKGHRYSLLALKSYIEATGDKDIRLIFTGKCEGKVYEEAKQLCDELRLTDLVEFFGQSSVEQTRDLYNQAHCAVLHSVTAKDGNQEGIPNALMEAMSMQLPVITSEHAGITELVTEDTFAKVVPERNIEAYADAIKFMRNNWRIAPENRTTVKQKFSRESFAKNIQQLYTDILSTD